MSRLHLVSNGLQRMRARLTRARWNGPRRWVAVAFIFALTTGVAWAFWSAGSSPGGNGASAAATVNQGATPSASAVGNVVTVSWAGSTLSNGDAADGYIVNRYDAATPFAAQTILSACTGTVTATTCTETAPPGDWVYSVTPAFDSNWRGDESAKSNAVTVAFVDESIPVNTITRSLVTGNAVMSGDTIFYRGVSAGSFRLINEVIEVDEGAASSATATLAGTTTGWTHSPSTVAAPTGGPYVSNLFSWSAGTTSAPTEVVTGTDPGGGQADTTLSFVNDSTAPTAGSITYAAGYQAGRSVAITFAAGTDSGSGLGAPQLQRSYAPLTAGSCGSYSSFANLGAASPVSPYTDSSVTNGLCYQYRYVVADLVGNQDIATSANVVMVDYAGAVNATTGLLSQWRLGESAANLTSSDSFTDSAATNLTNHTGERGAAWYNEAGSSSFERISNANRLRGGGSSGSSTGYAINYTNTNPPSPDYSVEADLVVVSNLVGDMAGVIGRLDTSNTRFYMARYEQASTRWNLVRYNNGTVTSLGVATQALTVGQAYRVRLSMTGTTLSLYVNGVLTVGPVTDATWTSTGKAGIMDGANSSSPVKSDTVGLHFDNFQVTPSTYPRAADSKGSNTGDYINGPTLGATGALAGDANTAAAFNGVNDYVQAVSTTAIPVGASLRSVEMWFKTTSTARQVLFAYGALANTQEFGLWLNAGGASMTAWGTSGTSTDNKTFTLASAVNDGAWHQVVKTYDGTSITLYIDGVALTPQAATRATVMDSYGFGIGAIINPGDATNSGGYFNGSLDEVSFYTTALDQATVTSHYQLGSSPAPDLSGPTGGSVAASGLVGAGTAYAPSTTLSLILAKGSDPSGVAATGAQLLRATRSLNSGSGSCSGSWSGYTLVADGADPTSPKSDTVADQACYRYQYVVADLLGNSTTWTSSEIKVDLTAPDAPSLSFGTSGNTYWSSGSTVFYRSAAATGSFTATASSIDTASGIASYGFPTLGTNWSTSGTSTSRTYSWSGPPAAPGTNSVTATNNATLTSAGTPFTLTADDTAPTGATVSYPDGVTGPSVSLTFTNGTDDGSGIGTRTMQRASATLTGSTCGTFGPFSTLFTNQSSPRSDNTVTGGNCYMYQYLVSDNVGNAASAATSANVVKIDATGPTGGSVAASGLVGTGSAYATSTTLSLDLVQGTDPNGIATTGNQLQRVTGTLSNGSCSGYGSYTLVTGGTDPASPKSDTVADQACYRYRYIVDDALGNPTTYQGTDIKVDLTAPAAPTLTFSNFSGNNTYWSGSGSTVFYRSAAASGSFRATASASDTRSGIASYAFPDLGTNWTSTPGTLGVNTYSWSGAPAAPGTNSVTATNNAAGTSAGTSFTLTADDTAPTAGTVSYLNGAQSSTSVSVSFTSGTDTGGSGIAASTTRVLQRAAAPLTSGVCGSYGSFTTVYTGSSSPRPDPVTRGFCYMYQYVVQDNVGNQGTTTSANVVTVPTYLDFIKGTTGLVSYWRLGDSETASDTFTDTAGVTLQSHTAEIGSPWTRHAASTTDAVITTVTGNSSRIRKNGSSTLGALYYSSGVPASADYTVEADAYRPGNSVTNDVIGIVGRLDTANALGTYYGAVYDKTAGNWVLYSMNNGVKASLGTYSATFSSTTTYHVALDMNGSTIRLLVGGTQRISVTDSTITAAGRAGVTMGFGASNTTVDNSNGMHLDNFTVSASVADSWGTNTGNYLNGPTLGVAGAITGDSNTAATFNGSNNYASVTRQISDDFSIEFWFKSNGGGSGSSSTWSSNAGLVDADVSGTSNDFGVSLDSNGRVVAGVGGSGGLSIRSSSSGYDNNVWHHVVFTRTMSTGALSLYVDGGSAVTGTGSTVSLTSPANINFGRIQSGSNYFLGSLDEVAVYNTALSAATVTDHYNAAR